MIKHSILLSLLTLSFLTAIAAPSRKIIDDGGSGPFKAEAISDPSLDNFVVYRPVDYKSATKSEGPLPLFVLSLIHI